MMKLLRNTNEGLDHLGRAATSLIDVLRERNAEIQEIQKSLFRYQFGFWAAVAMLITVVFFSMFLEVLR